MTIFEAQQIARLFHDTYERLAPSFGYETREDTKEFDPESPNGKLMAAVCSTVGDQIQKAERYRLMALLEKAELSGEVQLSFAGIRVPKWLIDQKGFLKYMSNMLKKVASKLRDME